MKYKIGQMVTVKLDDNLSLKISERTKKELQNINNIGAIKEIADWGFYKIENVTNWINEKIIEEITATVVEIEETTISCRFEILDL